MTTPPVYLGDASILELIKNGTLRRSHLNSELQARFAAAFDTQEAERITDTEEADA
jgi:hypothetical protein